MWSLVLIGRLPNHVPVEMLCDCVPAMGLVKGEMRATKSTHSIHQARIAWRITRFDRDVHLKHVLAHSSVSGNEFADSVAKAGEEPLIPIFFSRVSPLVTELVEKRKKAIFSIESAKTSHVSRAPDHRGKTL